MKLVIINGFDRSGTSMIGGLLSRHPDINYFFQPFSRTELHRSQYEYWATGKRSPDTESFLRNLQHSKLDRDYLKSPLFDEHSNYDLSIKNRVGVIKDTKLHTKIDWCRDKFPEIDIVGIWREPKAILCSLVRNGFHESWYGEQAYLKTQELIQRHSILSGLSRYTGKTRDSVEQMGVVIAARTRLMLQGLPASHWITYEHVLQHPDLELNKFCEKYGLSNFEYSHCLYNDFNASGLPFVREDLWKDYFTSTQHHRLDQIFGELNRATYAA